MHNLQTTGKPYTPEEQRETKSIHLCVCVCVCVCVSVCVHFVFVFFIFHFDMGLGKLLVSKESAYFTKH